MRSSTRPRRAAAAALGGIALTAALLLSGAARVRVPVGAEAHSAAPARISGVHASETHYDRTFRWTQRRARIEWPAVVGLQPTAAEVVLASFPGRAGDQVTVTVNDTQVSRHTLSGDWDRVHVDVPTAGGALTLEIRSLTHHAAGDARALGVRIESMTLLNGPPAAVLTTTSWWQVLVLLLAGALTVVGVAAAGGGIAGGLCAVAVLGGLLAWGRLWCLQLDSLRAFAASVTLAATVYALLVRGGTSRRMGAVSSVGAALPFLVLTALIPRYFVDVPRWDIWELVPLIEKYYDGTLGVADLWRSHNSHRPMTGRVLLLANVALARWNHWLDLAMLFTTAALQLVVLAVFVARTQRRATRVHPASLVVVAIFVFTLMQWENWLQGWQVLLLVGVTAVSASLLVLADGRVTTSRTAMAAALGFIGSASFLSCLLVWPLGALAILLRRVPGWRRRISAWVPMSIVVIAVYAWDLPPDPSTAQTALLLTWDGLQALALGVLLSVGTPALYRPGIFMGPTGSWEGAVLLTGALACLLALLAAVRQWRADEARETTWLFPLLLCLFGIGAGTMAAAGRVWISLQSMSASRYVVFGASVWIGLTLLLAIRRPVETHGLRWGRAALLGAIAVLAADNWRHAMTHVEAHYLSSSQARAWLLRDDNHAAASVLYPDPTVLDARRDVLEAHGLSAFRPGAR